MGKEKASVRIRLPKTWAVWYHQKGQGQGKESRSFQVRAALPISWFWTSPLLLKVAVLSFRSPRKPWHSSKSKRTDPIQVPNGPKACRSTKQTWFQVNTKTSVRWEDGKAGGRWRACSAKVTFCSVPCQPEGSALSGAKPTCSRVNGKRKSSQGKLTYNFKSASTLKVSSTSCWHKTRQVFKAIAEQWVS